MNDRRNTTDAATGKSAKMTPSESSVEDFLATISESRQAESKHMIQLMSRISGERPVMWGPSIIGFGKQHYRYETGREGDMPQLGFSPRKNAITIYFEGFDEYGDELLKLGKHKTSVACLYINKLADIDMKVLERMLKKSYAAGTDTGGKSQTVEDYVANVPSATRPLFDELRGLVRAQLPHAAEVLSYGIIGYKIDEKRARVFVSGWKDHVAMYPVPKSPQLQSRLAPYVKGKGTLWFPLDQPLPRQLISDVVSALTADA